MKSYLTKTREATTANVAHNILLTKDIAAKTAAMLGNTKDLYLMMWGAFLPNMNNDNHTTTRERRRD